MNNAEAVRLQTAHRDTFTIGHAHAAANDFLQCLIIQVVDSGECDDHTEDFLGDCTVTDDLYVQDGHSDERWPIEAVHPELVEAITRLDCSMHDF